MSFQCSFNRLIDDESFRLVDDINDSGGETFAGITRKYYPNWDGWNCIDKGNLPHCSSIFVFYFNEYWEKLKCDSFIPPVADSIFKGKDFSPASLDVVESRIADLTRKLKKIDIEKP